MVMIRWGAVRAHLSAHAANPAIVLKRHRQPAHRRTRAIFAKMGSLRSGGTSGVFGCLVPIMYAACPLSWNAISRTADMPIVRTGRIVRLNRLPIDPELTKSLRFIDGRFTKRPQRNRLLRKSGVCIMNILGGRTPRESARGRMRLSTVRAISMLAVVGVVGVLAGGQAVATQGNSDNITFCHRTNSVTNPYRHHYRPGKHYQAGARDTWIDL